MMKLNFSSILKVTTTHPHSLIALRVMGNKEYYYVDLTDNKNTYLMMRLKHKCAKIHKIEMSYAMISMTS